MKIENIPVSDIVPYENNPRENNITAEVLQDSIRKFGFTNPILLDENNVIVSGHARFKAALAMQLETVPCVHLADLSPEQLRAFRIMVNKAGEYSEWDFTKLDDEMQRIKELDDVEMDDLQELFGFDIGDPLDEAKLTKEKVEKSDDDDDNIVTCPFCGHSFDPDNPELEDEPEDVAEPDEQEEA